MTGPIMNGLPGPLQGRATRAWSGWLGAEVCADRSEFGYGLFVAAFEVAGAGDGAGALGDERGEDVTESGAQVRDDEC